jgi:hypothetical protein
MADTMVLTGPPFGKKSSVTIANEAGETLKESLIINRDDSGRARASASRTGITAHFLQHIFTILKQHGAPRWCCRTTSSSKAAPAKPSGVPY